VFQSPHAGQRPSQRRLSLPHEVQKNPAAAERALPLELTAAARVGWGRDQKGSSRSDLESNNVYCL
jgi:hypothetical protein